MKYNCKDVCMIRRPSLSIEDFRNWDENEYGKEDVLLFLEEHDISSYFAEALMISSPDLFKSMKRLGQNIKNDKETYLSIVEYLIRSTTRPTPYGMLAQVILSKLKEGGTDNFIRHDGRLCNRSIMTDFHWISHIVHSLEQEVEIVSNLKVRRNPIQATSTQIAFDINRQNQYNNRYDKLKNALL